MHKIMQSESITELAKALSKAQSECSAATKDKQNPFYKSNYATLEEIISVIKPILKDNALAITQFTDFDDVSTWIETKIIHASGQWMSGRYPVHATDNKPQSLGSAISYARRYALQSAMLVPAEDDDGTAAQSSYKEKSLNVAPKSAVKNETANIVETSIKWPWGKLKGRLVSSFNAKELSEQHQWLTSLDKKAPLHEQLLKAIEIELNSKSHPQDFDPPIFNDEIPF